MIVPDYYGRFRCIGGECRHNCCRGGWDVEVDDEALARFDAIPGEFGSRVRAAINDENVFIHKDGHCPLLSDDGWCEMVRHDIPLCIICDEYPRFTEFWDDYAERGISLSCEAAADIILNNTDKAALTGETGTCDEPIFTFIYNVRNEIFDLLQDRDTDIMTRLRLALDYAYKAQERINENIYETLIYTPADGGAERRSAAAYIDLLRRLEILDSDWGELLDRTYERERKGEAHGYDGIKTEQLAVYFVYRYFLKGAFDCDVLSKLKLAALSVLAICAVADTGIGLAEAARRYSVEVEHDEDNIDMIYDELMFDEGLSYENILQMLH